MRGRKIGYPKGKIVTSQMIEQWRSLYKVGLTFREIEASKFGMGMSRTTIQKHLSVAGTTC